MVLIKNSLWKRKSFFSDHSAHTALIGSRGDLQINHGKDYAAGMQLK
jgi:hypothetical protein